MMAAAWLAGTDPELMLAILNDRPGDFDGRWFDGRALFLAGGRRPGQEQQAAGQQQADRSKVHEQLLQPGERRALC